MKEYLQNVMASMTNHLDICYPYITVNIKYTVSLNKTTIKSHAHYLCC